MRLWRTGGLRRTGRLALDLLLPPRCAACDSAVEVQGLLCVACFGKTNFISAPFCGRCGVPFELASILAPMMARAGAVLLARADVLVPVPLHRRRLFLRKYNQAAILAFAVGRLAGRRVQPDALERTRKTAPLEEKSPEERAQEVAGAVKVKPSRLGQIVGRTVLLIDDVMTSGATANVCADALLKAGASAVDVLVAARVPDPRLR